MTKWCKAHITALALPNQTPNSSSCLPLLIFVPAMSHAAAKPFDACWRPDSEEEASKTLLSAKNNGLVLHLPTVTHRLVRLSLSMWFT